VSDENWIPWQLIKPCNGSQEEPFLGEKFVCSRWWEGELEDEPPQCPEICKLSPLGTLVAAETNVKDDLPYAKSEQDFLLDLAKRGIAIKIISPSRSELENAFQNGGFASLHIVGHTDCDEDDFERPELCLPNGDRLSALTITGELTRFGRECMLVFMNTCSVAQPQVEYCPTGDSGFVKVFLKAGVRAVVCSTWDLSDDQAAKFARVFYDVLLDGKTIGEAVRAARLEIYSDFDPTWLSYTFFGDPFGCLEGSPKAKA
jgi:CHAT domain-containing protein